MAVVLNIKRVERSAEKQWQPGNAHSKNRRIYKERSTTGIVASCRAIKACVLVRVRAHTFVALLCSWSAKNFVGFERTIFADNPTNLDKGVIWERQRRNKIYELQRP